MSLRVQILDFQVNDSRFYHFQGRIFAVRFWWEYFRKWRTSFKLWNIWRWTSNRTSLKWCSSCSKSTGNMISYRVLYSECMPKLHFRWLATFYGLKTKHLLLKKSNLIFMKKYVFWMTKHALCDISSILQGMIRALHKYDSFMIVVHWSVYLLAGYLIWKKVKILLINIVPWRIYWLVRRIQK